MKGNDEVIRDFNEYVNMTADELEKWLKSGDSQSAGWPKGDGAGESVGHDSGRKIVEILKANPKKDAKKYTEDQIQHMRKVVSYCARHLAQEEKSNNEKSPEEVKKTKSYASLKNWGHDPLKKRGAKGSTGNKGAAKKDANTDEETEKQKNGTHENGEENDDNADKRAGDKRKAADSQKGKNKAAKTEQTTEKRETRSSARNKPSEEKQEEKSKQGEKKTAAKEDNKKADTKKKEEESKKKKEEEAKKKKEQEAQKKEDEEKEKEDDKSKESGKKSGGKASKGPKPGEKVSWNWGSGQPEGKVLDVKEDKATITTKRGNKVSRDGSKDDPAVVLDTGKSKAIKSNHELN